MNSEPETYVINERVVSDDFVTFAAEGETLDGGHAATVTYHTFANPWEDDEHVVGFPSREAAEDFIVKRYGKTSDELVSDLADEYEGATIHTTLSSGILLDTETGTFSREDDKR